MALQHDLSQSSRWTTFVDFRRPLEKDDFWAAVYYIDAAFGLLINFMMAIVRIFHYYSILGETIIVQNISTTF